MPSSSVADTIEPSSPATSIFVDNDVLKSAIIFESFVVILFNFLLFYFKKLI